MKKSGFLIFISILLCSVKLHAQEMVVEHCFLTEGGDLIAQEKVLEDGSRLLLIITGSLDSTVPYIVKLDANNDLAWKTKAGTFYVTYDPLIIQDQQKIFVTPHGEVFFLNINLITNSTTFTKYALSYAVIDQHTGSVTQPLTVIDTFDNGYLYQQDYDGIQLLQSSGPGAYVLYASEVHLQESPEGFRTRITQYIIDNYSDITVRDLPVYPEVPDYPSTHKILAFQDDSLLLMTHFNGGDNMPVVQYLEIFDNNGASISHYFFDDTLPTTAYWKSIRVVERLNPDQYVLMQHNIWYDPSDSLHIMDRFLLLDIAEDTITLIKQVPENTLVGYLYQMPEDFVSTSWDYGVETPFADEFNAYYNPDAPVYYFFRQNDSVTALFRIDGDSFRLVNDHLPPLNVWKPYFRLDNGAIVFVFSIFGDSSYNLLVKLNALGQVMDSFSPETLPGSITDYFTNDIAYLSNEKRLFYRGEFDYGRMKLPLQIIDLENLTAGPVIYVPLDDPIVSLANAYDDAEGDICMVAQPYRGVCYPGAQDVVIYKLAAVPTAVPYSRSLSNDIAVYPNPARDQLIVDLQNLTGENVRLRLFDLSGKLLLDQAAANTRAVLDIRSLAAGSYVLQAESAFNVAAVKVVITR